MPHEPPPPIPNFAPTGAREPTVSLMLLGFSVLLTAALAWPSFWARPLAIDETVSFWIADRSSPSTLLDRSLRYSATPPLSFALQRVSLEVISRTEAGLRLPALMAHLAAVVAFWWFARGVATPWAAGLSAVLFATHPLVLKFAADARPYSLGLLLAVVAIGQTTRPGRDGPIWARGAGWAVSNVALLYVHYLYGLVWLVELVWLLGPGRPRGWSRRRVLGLFVLAGLATLPMGFAMLRIWEHRQQLNWVTEPPPLFDTVSRLLPLDTARLRSPWMLLAIVALAWSPVRFGWQPTAWCDAASRRGLAAVLPLATLASILPVLGLWGLASSWLPSLATDRYMLVYVPGMALLVGCLAAVPRGRVASLMLVLLVTWLQGVEVRVQQLWQHLFSSAAPAVLRDVVSLPAAPVGRDPAWRHAAELLADVHANDWVLVNSGLIEVAQVPTRYRDTTFQDYVTCRLTRLYRPEPFRRLSLPLFWTRELSVAYREMLRADGPRRVWLVAATDTDLLEAAARRARELLQAAGWSVATSYPLDGVVVEQYHRAAP